MASGIVASIGGNREQQSSSSVGGTYRMSVHASMLEYIRSMLARVNGIKVLLLDEETTGIISLIYSQSEVLEHEVFLIDRLDSPTRQPVRHLKALCFVRPTASNLVKLGHELKAPLYKEYHLFFTNVVPHQELGRLARNDEFELVQQVQEFFGDFYAFHHHIFSLNMPTYTPLLLDPSVWNAYEESLFRRITDGLFAVICALRMKPTVRIQKSSPLASKLGRALLVKVNEESTLFEGLANLTSLGTTKRNESSGVSRLTHRNVLVLILDRREDPVTPLLNQWTYQAMLHELIGIDNNRVDLSNCPDYHEKIKQLVVSPYLDSFYDENYLANFGQLGFTLKEYIDSYKKSQHDRGEMESLEDIQRFIEIYPEYKRLTGNVSKHATLMQELSRIVSGHNLIDSSSLEQDLACYENMQEQFRQIQEKLKDTKLPKFEKLRLVLLYTLRYEGDASIGQLKNSLRQSGLQESEVSLIPAIVKYAGKSSRSGDLFQNKSFFAVAKNSITRGLKGTYNVLTQHKSLLASTLDLLSKGKLKESTHPFIASSDTNAGSAREKPENVLVFIVGGATYEEARDAALFNASGSGCQVLLGGTTIHNSKTFLADVSQVLNSSTENRQNVPFL